jgi:hypothetical protein
VGVTPIVGNSGGAGSFVEVDFEVDFDVGADVGVDVDEVSVAVRWSVGPAIGCPSLVSAQPPSAMVDMNVATRTSRLIGTVWAAQASATQRNPMWVVALSCDCDDRAAGR